MIRSHPALGPPLKSTSVHLGSAPQFQGRAILLLRSLKRDKTDSRYSVCLFNLSKIEGYSFYHNFRQ